VDRLDEIDLEEAMNVKEIDPSMFIPPAVLAVYGEKGMPTPPVADGEPSVDDELSVDSTLPDDPNGDGFFDKQPGGGTIISERPAMDYAVSRPEALPAEPPRSAEILNSSFATSVPAGDRQPRSNLIPPGTMKDLHSGQMTGTSLNRRWRMKTSNRLNRLLRRLLPLQEQPSQPASGRNILLWKQRLAKRKAASQRKSSGRSCLRRAIAPMITHLEKPRRRRSCLCLSLFPRPR
jgi:hypothetical protein